MLEVWSNILQLSEEVLGTLDIRLAISRFKDPIGKRQGMMLKTVRRFV